MEPWKRYQTQQPAQADGPWTKFNQPAQPTAQAAPQQQSAPLSHRIGAGLGGVLKGATLGASDHIEAGLSSLLPIDRLVAPDGSADIRFGQFKNNLEQVRQRNAKQKAAAPKTHLAGQIGGSVLGVGKLGAAGLLPSTAAKGKGLAATTAGAAADGVAIAGVDAFFNGKDVKKSAGQGGVIGAGLNVLTRGVGGPIANALFKGKKPTVPTTQELLENAGKTRKQIKDAGIEFSPDQLKQLSLGVTDDIPLTGIDAVGGRVGKIAKKIDKNSNQPATFEQLDNLRKQIDLPVTASNSDKRLAGILRSNIDDFVNSVNPAKGPKSKDVKELIDTSRDFTRRGRTAEALENAVEAAKTRTAKSGTGGNLDNNLRSEIDKVLKKQGKFMTEAQRKQLEAISRGTKGQNLARLIGRGLSPNTGALNMFATGAATIGTQGANIPFQLAGLALKKGSEKATANKIDDVIRQIQAGSPQAAARVQTPLQQKATDPEVQRLLVQMGLAPAVIAQNQ